MQSSYAEKLQNLLDTHFTNEEVQQIFKQCGAEKNLPDGMVTLDSSQIKIEGKLGAGMYATVMQGVWNNEKVAVKTFDLCEENIAKQIKHFFVEMHILHQLANTPNIIGCKGLDIQRYHIVLEYAEQGSLADLIKRGPISHEKSYGMITGILKGLDGMHKKDILHRDLMSANILVDKNDEIKIIDFGSASKRLSRYHDNVGSSWYRAPETFFRPHYSQRADIYSLSCIILELAFGKLMTEILPADVNSMTLLYNYLKARTTLTFPENCPQTLTSLAERTSHFDPNKRSFADELLHQPKPSILCNSM